ncbi:MAG: arginase family protein [Candidatus Omnitrophica bacterium]|jgi:arginase family enzyme|nr:arginase family protein [Candidatus Omnitrophota bacterium]
MLNQRPRVLDFDNSLIRQNKFIERFQPVIVGLKEIAPSARLWLNKKTESEIKKSLQPEMKNAVTFFGSGDFHHISSLLIEQFSEPISVIVFDYHPDWDTLPPKTGCGSWVSRILKMPNVLKVVLLGISSDDISTFNIQSGNLDALKNNRLEIYPYEHEPARVWLRRVPENISISRKKNMLSSEIRWQQLKEKNLVQFMTQLIQRLETRQVYLSLDKDCLNSEFALTNWEEGKFAFSDLLSALKIIKEQSEIIGMDVTGEYSPALTRGRIKTFCSRLDHPGNFSAFGKTDVVIDAINAETNIKILETMIG